MEGVQLEEAVEDAKFRKRFIRILTGNRTIISSVSRNMAIQNSQNGPKVAASKSAASSLHTATVDLSTQVEMSTHAGGNGGDGSDGDDSDVGSGPRKGSTLTGLHAQRPQFATQGGGKGAGAQTGIVRPKKKNDGRLHERTPVAQSTSEYNPSDDSGGEEGSPQRKRKRRRTVAHAATTTTVSIMAKKQQEESESDGSDGRDEHGGENVADNHDDDDDEEGGDGDDEDDDAEEDDDEEDSEDEDDDEGDGDKEESEEDDEGEEGVASGSVSDSSDDVRAARPTSSKKEQTPAKVRPRPPVTAASVPAKTKPIQPIIRNGFMELPSDHEDFYENVQPTSEYSDTDDGGDVMDWPTHMHYVETGLIVNTDEADETDDEGILSGDARKPVPLSKRTKYFSPMKEQQMTAFKRIRRFDRHERGCYLTLGNPPNIFDFSTPLRLAAQEEARKVFASQKPFAGKEGRNAKFKEKVWSSEQEAYITAKFTAEGAAIADAMHTYAQYVFTGLLKTAPHGSTFYEMVNQVSFKKARSPAMMLRSQVDPYRSVFTSALSYAKDLHCLQYKRPNEAPPLPQKLQRMAVMEMICRSKSITKSRVNCHKVDDNGVKIELAKRKERKAKQREIDF